MNCNLNGSGPPCSDDYRQFWLLWEKKQQNSRLTNIQVSPSFIPLKANWVNLSLIDKNAVFHLNKMSHIAPKFDREIEREKCLDLQLSAVSRRS